ncbi:hypothetical protein KXD93_17725 [Mucilaginibacter sp. BJC16-A38]|uniref:hypothetical protein n=1 Tax=Mucilaginibacter phenanthrenivorans TaxID=1234842 RepID=UPI0021572046|nr:hypothetical protein [Mucilaginibacter phenanthrenivorans]MCR8559502.1 hypothetical protein [Mucilaginibacter phenanthrenivorans]
MASTYAKRSAVILYGKLALPCLMSVVLLSCKNNKGVYKSNCDIAITFKKVTFTKLIDSIKNYDQQYVEVSGIYKEAREQSALYNDSLFTDHSDKHAIWINFSQDCPLYLEGTHTGLFEASDGGFTPMNNKNITVRGRIDLHNTGHLGHYKATMDRVSFVEL